jgi:hypothetical protein
MRAIGGDIEGCILQMLHRRQHGQVGSPAGELSDYSYSGEKQNVTACGLSNHSFGTIPTFDANILRRLTIKYSYEHMRRAKRRAAIHPNQHRQDTALETVQIDGTKAPEFDKLIVGNLLLTHTNEPSVRKQKMVIGIRNDTGTIYRLIGANKINSFMNAVEELIDLDLLNELQDVEGPREGCDAIFAGV